MTEVTNAPTAQRKLTWRNPDVRSVAYQILTVLFIGGAAAFLVFNYITNLETRGISAGFDFLQSLAGFGIGEVIPVPQLEPSFVTFFGSIFVGIGAAWLLSGCRSSRCRRRWRS